MTPGPPRDSASAPSIRVRAPDGRTLRFAQTFHIGRDEECELRVEDTKVSRRHVLVSCDRGFWSLQDLRSANGVFVDGERVETATILNQPLTITLGRAGPALTLEVERPAVGTDLHRTQFEAPPEGAHSFEEMARRYFGVTEDEAPVGRRTMMIRQAFREVQQKQKRKYIVVVVAVSVIGLAAAGYAVYASRQMQQQRVIVEDLFYQIKSLDVSIAEIERQVATSGDRKAQNQVAEARARRRDMEQSYDRMIASLNIYDRRLTEQDRLILRVTRLFGECELAAPPEYLDEVGRFIKMWQSTPRFERGVRLAQEKGYIPHIVKQFTEQNLPPQFFYLALQESNFDAFATGPPTYMGLAKGMWQFVPDTGKRYGLTIGPLVAVAQADAGDDRHKWDKATIAAAKYIKDIYATDAQASGLLVMAGYNWGENRVIRNIRSLSANPRDRNFWKLTERFRIPDETYNYVFSIVSAAVIGENPRTFGFSFDNPLQGFETTP